VPNELHAPLPTSLQAARRDALEKYYTFEEHEALKVYEAHRPQAEEPGPEVL